MSPCIGSVRPRSYVVNNRVTPYSERMQMYKRILVPLDGSTLSELALPYAQQLAQAFNAVIYLVSALQNDIEAKLPDQITSEAKHEVEVYMQRICDSLPSAQQPKYQVSTGYPEEVIVDQANAQGGTLIVMSTHGYSGLKRLILGSVASKVAQVAEAPVLLIPAGAKGPHGGPVDLRRVIVPLDGSSLAEYVLPPVIELCTALDMELFLVRAYNPSFPGSSIRMKEISKIVHDAAESYIKAKAAELQAFCGREVNYRVFRGVPAEQIVDFALETQNSMTAMCTHGRHGPGRWLLGSVTDAVMRVSEEPVLVIRGPRNSP